LRLRELIGWTPFRWALLVAAVFVVCTLVLFGFFYWQTTLYVTGNIDAAIVGDATSLAGEPIADMQREVSEAIVARLRDDPRRIKLAGLFGPDGARIAGNIAALPATLPVDGRAHAASLTRIDGSGREAQTVRAVAVRLASGCTLLFGRDADEVRRIAAIVGRALALGLLPATCLALLAGALLSVRAQRRIATMSRQAGRIVSGELQERLPVRRTRDPFDSLAAIVNRMLDDIEMLVQALAGVGEDIAHDIRTPLTRVRATLEQGRDRARSLDELQGVTDRAIGGLDQSLGIINAVLRIAEIDHQRRLAALDVVQLDQIIDAVGELYDPIAEDKGVALRILKAEPASVIGDRDLLFEAVANLVDNAVKFTPAAGSVSIGVLPGPVIQVADTGPGISGSERDAVTRRFYRSDKSRGTAGAGLGLSLVAAIVKLHSFALNISPGPGCVVEINCRPTNG